MRGRNRNNKGPNPLTRSYESNGPDVKIRGTAQHIAEKYSQLARDAQAAGDPIAAENYLQHAEHYFRIIAASQEQLRQQYGQYQRASDDEHDEAEGDGEENGSGFSYDRNEQPSSDEEPEFSAQPQHSYDNGIEGRRERPQRGERRSRYGRVGHRSQETENRFDAEAEGEETADAPAPARRERYSRQETDERPATRRRAPVRQPREAEDDASGSLPAFLTNPVRQSAAPKQEVTETLFGNADEDEAPKPVRRRRRTRTGDETETGVGNDI